MKRVIITGATGSVGTAFINKCIEEGTEVLVFTRKDSKRNNRIPNSPLVTMVYCSLDELSTIQNETGKKYDVFYHLAWDGTVGEARNNMYLQNMNVKYALDAVGAAKRFGCDRFVGIGSQAEYGRVEGTLKATTPAFPEMGYGIGKLCAGHMTREHAHQLGMEHMWIRILSIYGPNDGLQSMVMSTIQKLTDGVVPQFTKGEQMWDYLYSGDAGNALYLVGERGIDSKVYILGSGNARPLKDYIEEIRQVVDPNAQIDLGAVPYGARQVMYLCADINELTVDTGFTPKVSFTEGIEKTVNWYKGEYKA